MAFGHLRERALALQAVKKRQGRIEMMKAIAAYHCYFCPSKKVEPIMTRIGSIVLVCDDCYVTYERFIKR